MQVATRATEILHEWWLDCQNLLIKHRVRLPHYGLIKDALFRPSEKSYKDLADFLEAEFVNEMGVMPPAHVKIMDLFCRSELNVEFSIREEQHELYWLLRNKEFK